MSYGLLDFHRVEFLFDLPQLLHDLLKSDEDHLSVVVCHWISFVSGWIEKMGSIPSS